MLLTVTAQRRSRWRPMQRTKLYRMVERIGRWSMLDVFVVTLTVALVRFKSIAVITAGPWRHCVRLGGDSDHDRVDAVRPTAHLGHRGWRGQQCQKEGETREQARKKARKAAPNNLRTPNMTSPQGPTPAPSAPRNDSNGPTLPPNLPDPEIEPRSHWLPSLVWVIPLIAALIGIALVIKSVTEKGPEISISFSNAEGLEPGKTQVKYKDVNIGLVKNVTLSKDLSHVLIQVQLTKEAENFAVKDTRFWVVRPRVGASGVSGLGTLLSGAYIGVDAGHSQDTQKDFVGLETPPPITGDQKGHRFTLHGDSLGSIDIGSPIFYRRVQVGQVVGFSLDKDGTGVTMQVFVAAPYDQYVGVNTRWWHASGVDLRLDSSGFKLNTQSLATVLVGGLSFQSPPGQPVGAQAPQQHDLPPWLG